MTTGERLLVGAAVVAGIMGRKKARPAPSPRTADAMPAAGDFNATRVRALLSEFAGSIGIMQKLRLANGSLTRPQIAALQAIPRTPDSRLKDHLDGLFSSFTLLQRGDLRSVLDDDQRAILATAGYPV